MNYKPFIYSGVFFLLYSIFLTNEKQDWIYGNSIVTKVKVNDTVITEVNGLEISEIQSNADVIYKVNDDIYTSNISVTQNQPLQLGNVIPIKYDNNIVQRRAKGIPEIKYFTRLGLLFIIIGTYIYWKKSTEC
jgi:hypothetical protein